MLDDSPDVQEGNARRIFLGAFLGACVCAIISLLCLLPTLAGSLLAVDFIFSVLVAITTGLFVSAKTASNRMLRGTPDPAAVKANLALVYFASGLAISFSQWHLFPSDPLPDWFRAWCLQAPLVSIIVVGLMFGTERTASPRSIRDVIVAATLVLTYAAIDPPGTTWLLVTVASGLVGYKCGRARRIKAVVEDNTGPADLPSAQVEDGDRLRGCSQEPFPETALLWAGVLLLAHLLVGSYEWKLDSATALTAGVTALSGARVIAPDYVYQAGSSSYLVWLLGKGGVLRRAFTSRELFIVLLVTVGITTFTWDYPESLDPLSVPYAARDDYEGRLRQSGYQMANREVYAHNARIKGAVWFRRGAKSVAWLVLLAWYFLQIRRPLMIAAVKDGAAAGSDGPGVAGSHERAAAKGQGDPSGES